MPYHETLPRLLYLGEAPIEHTYHGAAALYRLLEDYPADKLLVMEAAPRCSQPSRRLPGVTYKALTPALIRGARTRFSRYVSSWILMRAGLYYKEVERQLGEFRPDAVLTLVHSYSCLTAAEFARRLSLPLHLILHDNWVDTLHVLPVLDSWQRHRFTRIYRQAASRLCVSPGMEEECRRLTGMSGEVLYPAWPRECPAAATTPATWTRTAGPLTAAYAGSINHSGYAAMLRELAESLDRRGGRLIVFGPNSRERLAQWDLDRPNILHQGFVSSQSELLSRLQTEADFLFVPMDPDTDPVSTRMSFPSKIADYTSTGLPLLIQGPDFCSAVRWRNTYSPTTEVVTSRLAGDIDAAVSRLQSAEYRRELGMAARDAGRRMFSHACCSQILRNALVK